MRTAAALIVIAAAGLISGCTSGSSGGPMMIGGAEYCGPDAASPTHRLVWGEDIQVAGGFPVEVLDVSFGTVRNLAIDDAFVSRVRKGDMEFGMADFGADGMPEGMSVWAARESVAGARLSPGGHTNLILVLHRPDRSVAGRATDLAVTYVAGGRIHVAHSDMSLTVVSAVCR